MVIERETVRMKKEEEDDPHRVTILRKDDSDGKATVLLSSLKLDRAVEEGESLNSGSSEEATSGEDGNLYVPDDTDSDSSEEGYAPDENYYESSRSPSIPSVGSRKGDGRLRGYRVDHQGGRGGGGGGGGGKQVGRLSYEDYEYYSEEEEEGGGVMRRSALGYANSGLNTALNCDSRLYMCT